MAFPSSSKLQTKMIYKNTGLNKSESGPNWKDYTAQKMKFSIKDFFSKCDQIRSFLRIWSHILKKSLMENFIFCAVLIYPEGLDSTGNLLIIDPVIINTKFQYMR